MQSSIGVSHANQLCFSCLPDTKSNDTVIPINILLDTFELPQSLQVKSINNQRLKKGTMRRTNHKCKLNITLEIDPCQTSYKHHTSRERC